MAEKGIEIDTVQVDLMKGEQLTEEFREINPLGQVPVLELDDGTRITEVMAICRYLEEIYPDNSLFGRDPVERAKVESINDQLQANGMVAVMEAFRNATPGFVDRALPGPHNYAQIPALSERGLLSDWMISSLTLEAHLAEQPIHGWGLFLCRRYYRVCRGRVCPLGEEALFPTSAASLQRWYQQVKQRPSTAA